MYEFAPTPQAAQARLDMVSPKDYAHTRNALDGAVTHLSPYITHGFLSVPDIAYVMFHRHRLGVQHKFMFELGWREYFQHLHKHYGDGIGESLRQGILPDASYKREIPDDVIHACSHVPVIDHAVRMLYATGYLHNHARLWLASYLVHLRKVHWRVGADWMYSHLLDGDMASNYLSWQWVSATGSTKPYLFNAENVEKFAPPAWFSRGTVLDATYETIEILAHSPAVLTQSSVQAFEWHMPPVSAEPPASLGFVAPDANTVKDREVWLVHPWALADIPKDLPANIICIAVVWSDVVALRPWSERRWQFVGQRMLAMADQSWFGSTQVIENALAQAKSVHTIDHLRIPEMPFIPWQKRPAPRLFRELDQPMESFSKWWVKVNNGVRHLQQLVYPLAPRELSKPPAKSKTETALEVVRKQPVLQSVLNRRVQDEPPQ
jgi:deoxyribodipyrimidine photo-lyase